MLYDRRLCLGFLGFRKRDRLLLAGLIGNTAGGLAGALAGGLALAAATVQQALSHIACFESLDVLHKTVTPLYILELFIIVHGFGWVVKGAPAKAPQVKSCTLMSPTKTELVNTTGAGNAPRKKKVRVQK